MDQNEGTEREECTYKPHLQTPQFGQLMHKIYTYILQAVPRSLLFSWHIHKIEDRNSELYTTFN